MEYKIIDKDRFTIVGISIRTENKDGKAQKDIYGLWQQWYSEKIEDKIPNKISKEIYNLYTNYESDHNSPYTVVLGCEVSSAKAVQSNFTVLEIPSEKYAVYEAKGKIPDIVLDTWEKIYSEKKYKRKYSFDFDAYSQENTDPNNTVLKTFVSII